MPAPSAKPLFSAMKAKRKPAQAEVLFAAETSVAPAKRERRQHDLYPTGEPEAIRSLLAADSARIRPGPVWEPAAGYGHMVREIEAAGLACVRSDLVDHGCPGVVVRSFYDWREAPARVVITNPPYCEINARDGHGRWLRHMLALSGWDYCALLLSWDWPAARANGLGALLDQHSFSYCYLMRWKLDFTGEGSPPQRNAWFIWDKTWTGTEPAFRWMDKEDGRQGSLFGRAGA
ncbi:hypothetical protein [Stappia sp.]|uniref:hypothetical protein n=1 Tax=Stappia sp. TaxID=1870903 RepID=UPI003C7B735B